MKIPAGYVITEKTIIDINETFKHYLSGMMTSIAFIHNMLAICNDAIIEDRKIVKRRNK
jgi:hypothetical protein